MDHTREVDKQYLERSGTNALIKEAIIKLINNRPSDPVSFLIDMFESKSTTGDNVQRAYRQIMLTDYYRSAFDENVELAFNILCQTKDGGPRPLTGDVCMELIGNLLKVTPANIRTKVQARLHYSDHEIVSLTGFKSAVVLCLILQDYLRNVEVLFNALEIQGNSKVDRNASDAVKQVLEASLSSSAGGDHPSQVLKAMAKLSTREVYGQLYVITQKTSTSKAATISKEEFLSEFVDIFLAKRS